MSLPEVLLRERPKGRSSGSKFRRQHPVGPSVVDFHNRETSLAIEIDGEFNGSDDRINRDEHRDAYLRQNGLTIIRIAASDVLHDPDAVAASIVSLVASPLHQPAAGPPPRTGEDQE